MDANREIRYAPLQLGSEHARGTMARIALRELVREAKFTRSTLRSQDHRRREQHDGARQHFTKHIPQSPE